MVYAAVQFQSQSRYSETDNREWRNNASFGEEKSWINKEPANRFDSRQESNTQTFPTRGVCVYVVVLFNMIYLLLIPLHVASLNYHCS
ncbi:hypothetical protein QQ045_033429 [Rhodiola kirilowii]